MKYVGLIKDIVPELLKLDMEKYYVCDIKEPRTQRSLRQNRLLWELIHKIAKATQQDDMDVYCTILERADAKSEYIITAMDIEDTLRKNFRGAKFIRYQEVNGKQCHVFKVYIGSSKMDTKEMKELLEITIQVASELGIPTLLDD